MLKNMPKISIFVPVYNEEKILEKNIQKLHNCMGRLKANFEIFIVDDFSKDNTSFIARKLEQKYEELHFVRYENGPSRRENLAKSFCLARGDIILYLDADLSADLNHLPDIINAIEQGFDISIGSRYVKGASVRRSFQRRLISNMFKYFMRAYYGSEIKDHECGFKAFKRDILLNLVREMGYDSKFQRKMFWDAEMLIRAQKKGYKIKEIPVRWVAGEKSVLRFKNELSMVPYMFLFKFRL